MRMILIGFALGISVIAPALAQIGNPAGMTPGVRQEKPGVPAPHQPNIQDRVFSRLATAGGLAEVDLGLLADKRGQGDEVKAFGRRMADDHSKANTKLAGLAKQADIALPIELDPEHKAIRTKLEKSDGAAFDLGYVDAQVQDHIKTAQLLEWEIDSGQDADIQHFASEALPVVLDHLHMAQALQMRLRTQAAR